MTTPYFGVEPTCRRCDYPRRLHDLLRVHHAFEPCNENAPAAEPGWANTRSDEGTNRANLLERTDSMPQFTDVNAALMDEIVELTGRVTCDDQVHFEHLAIVDVGGRLRLSFDRLDVASPTGDRLSSEYLVSFDKPVGMVDVPELDPEQIPALIDELTVIYRQWRDLAAREGEL